jgi:chromosome partitioning protein
VKDQRDIKVIAISNQKGGVGKTTTAVNFGAALADRGKRVLVLDLDPQGNGSTHLGVDIYNLDLSIYDVLVADEPLANVIRPTGMPNLFCAPSNIDLSGAEVEMVSAVGRETILKEAIDEWANPVDADANPAISGADFDFILIDCPPSLGLLCINALAAADEILIPMQTEFFALQGMSKLMDVVEVIRKRINSRLHVGGIVACRMDTRTRLALEVLDDIKNHFPDLLFNTRIRQNVKLAESPSFGRTVLEYAPESNGAEDYRSLAAEYLGEVVATDLDDETDDSVEETDTDESANHGATNHVVESPATSKEASRARAE